MESSSKLKLSRRSAAALRKIADGAAVGPRLVDYLERLGLVQTDLLTGRPSLTQDGREHLWG